MSVCVNIYNLGAEAPFTAVGAADEPSPVNMGDGVAHDCTPVVVLVRYMPFTLGKAGGSVKVYGDVGEAIRVTPLIFSEVLSCKAPPIEKIDPPSILNGFSVPVPP